MLEMLEFLHKYAKMCSFCTQIVRIVPRVVIFWGLLFCGTALMPRFLRSAERRAAEDRDRRAAESPASRQARLASDKAARRLCSPLSTLHHHQPTCWKYKTDRMGYPCPVTKSPRRGWSSFSTPRMLVPERRQRTRRRLRTRFRRRMRLGLRTRRFRRRRCLRMRAL